MKKTRKRLPGLIRGAPNSKAAARLAIFGEDPPTGRIAELFEMLFLNVRGGYSIDGMAPYSDVLWDVFAPAIVKLDEQPFLHAAAVITKLRDWAESGFAADPVRVAILGWKQRSDLSQKERRRLKIKEGRCLNIRTLRKNLPGIFQNIDDRHIRRVARELGLKLRTNKRRKPA